MSLGEQVYTSGSVKSFFLVRSLYNAKALRAAQRLAKLIAMLFLVSAAMSVYAGFVHGQAKNAHRRTDTVSTSRPDQATATATATATANRLRGRDEFGAVLAAASKPTGFFTVKKIANRWYFVSPSGHPFWMRAVYAVNLTDGGESAAAETLRTKYHNDWTLFATHAVKKLRAWGFNALGEYSTVYTYPVPTYMRPRGNPVTMPLIRLLNISHYGTYNNGHLAPGPFKTLLAGAVDPQIYKDWPGNVPDVFDPNFEIYAQKLAGEIKSPSSEAIFTEKGTNGGLPHPSLSNTPWLIGTTPDDADYVFGFGPGPEQPGRRGVVHPHIGWVVAVTRPAQSSNTEVGSAFGDRQTVRYDDPVVYAKRAWRDFLQQEYKNIASLNSAWGSTYTTFDSDGGWPHGKGLMDESGRSSWIGSNSTGPFSNPHVAADLNKFLGVFADRYFRIVTQAIRAATPHHLVFGTGPLNSHSGMTRRPILEAAARYCDVIQTDFRTEKPEILDATYAITGKPMFVWMGTTANKDSAFHAYDRNETLTTESQKERAALYRREVEWLFNYQTHSGIHPIIGLDWWEYMDKWAEKASWGLVTPRDNSYDGREAVMARGKDSGNFPTGGEDRNYGDFLSAVTQTNLAIDKKIAGLLPRATLPTASKPAQKKPK